MKAELKCYQCNADLFVDGGFHVISWDGLEFDNESDWQEWADEQLTPASTADNYEYIKQTLFIYTQHLIKD